MKKIKRIEIKEFLNHGYLQEVNRRFLHPLGLALEVVVDNEGSYQLGGVWDYRDDPEGLIFSQDMIEPEKIKNIHMEWVKKTKTRLEKLGYVIQEK